MMKMYKHNQQAYEVAMQMLIEVGKVTVIHPTGTGKSCITFKSCEDYPQSHMLWCSPSRHIFGVHLENLKKSEKFVFQNIRFYTYEKLVLMASKEITKLRPDYLILDELHHFDAEICDKSVSTLVEMYNSVPILGQAIGFQILNPPTYITSLHSYPKEFEKIQHRPECFGGIDSFLHTYKAYSDDMEARSAFADFVTNRSSHLKVLFCIDMLNEGIHVWDVAGVILFWPIVFAIVYKQQIGRAMSARSREGSVILDIVDNIFGLSSIGAIQEEIQEAINVHRFYGNLEMPQCDQTKEEHRLRQQLSVQRDIYRGMRVGKQRRQLNVAGMSWSTVYKKRRDKNFERTKKFAEKSGPLIVTREKKQKNPSLCRVAYWLQRQRDAYNVQQSIYVKMALN